MNEMKKVFELSRKIQSSPTGNRAYILLRHVATHSFRAHVLGDVGSGSTKLRKFFFGNNTKTTRYKRLKLYCPKVREVVQDERLKKN